MRPFLKGVLALVVCCGLSLPVQAQVLGVAIDQITTDMNNGVGYTLGWEFVVSDDILVTHLGYYDDQVNGMSETHDVGLWDAGGTLLVQGTVTTADPVDNYFRFTDVTDTWLSAGGTYIVGGVSGLVDNYTFDPGVANFGEEITYVTDRWISGNFLQFPTSAGGTAIGWFGGNFKYIPEPASLALLVLGGLTALRRR